MDTTTNLLLFHLNISSIPDHFLEFTSFLNVLNVELKVKIVTKLQNKIEEGVYVYIYKSQFNTK